MATDLFLKVDGITGESADAKHRGWIDLVDFSWGTSQRGTMAQGGGGGAGKAAFHDLHVNAVVDQGTSGLLKYCAAGKHIAEVKLSLCKAGGEQIEYATVVLKDALVTSVHFGAGSGDGLIHVDYAFQAAKVEQHYWTQSKNGGKGPECQFGWDIKQNQATA